MKNRLIFLYVQNKSSPGTEWNRDLKASNFYTNRVLDEGYYHLVKRMQETGIVDEVVVIVESGIGQGFVQYQPGIKGWVLPDIEELHCMLIKDKDILFIRGGFKSWHDPLKRIKEDGHKMLMYAANTGREKWPWWDVVFNDLNPTNEIDSCGRLQFDFKKPTNPDLFYYIPGTKMVYDLCLGSSHIHDKKGQHKTISALLKYREIFNEDPICIMPGSVHRGIETAKAMDMLKRENLNVFMPGMVNRKNLNAIYNQSKFLIHLGGGGQGDRAPIEAMRCGCSTIIGNTRRHSKLLYQDKELCTVFPEDMTDEEIARELYYKIKIYDIKTRKKLYSYYEENAGVETVILPEIKKLFDTLKK